MASAGLPPARPRLPIAIPRQLRAGVTGEDLRPRQISGLVYGVFIIGWIQNLAGQNLRPRQISGKLIRSDERAPTQFSDLINITI